MNFTDKDYEDARRLQMAWHQHYIGCSKSAGYSKHPIVAAALIFYAIGFSIGYVVGMI